ncbi:hypothetical protein [Actinomadura rubrobrunea]|uniref:hypothetical protein n=1 Tax=Actinomadura rubrobrunea TaxID=115335 RepID=UPI0011B1F50C|nr:hypothetical protein [Actinomadura rubrobrunea]
MMVLAGMIGAALLVTGVTPGLSRAAAASAGVHMAATPASPEPSPTAPAGSLNSPPAQTPGTVEPKVQAPGSSHDNIGTPRKKCGFADLACMAGDAVTGWFRDLVESASKPTFAFLSTTVLGTPEIDSPEMKRARELWGTSQWIANTCFLLMVTITGILLMAGQSLPGELSPKELLPRLLLAFLASNLSLILIGHGILLANGLAKAFLTAGGNKIDPAQAGTVLGNGVEASINTVGTFFVLVALVAVALALIVAFIYVARLAITMVLIAAAPLALMFHALPMTDGIARLWWRGITGMLAIQVCQSLVLVSALQVLFADTKDDGPFHGVPTTEQDLIDVLLVICLLWVMIRIPSWVARTIWRSAQPRMLGQLVRSFLVYRTVSAAISTVGRAVRGGRATHTGKHRGGPGGGPRSRPGPGGWQPGGGPGSSPGGTAGNPRPRHPGGGPTPANRHSGDQPERRHRSHYGRHHTGPQHGHRGERPRPEHRRDHRAPGARPHPAQPQATYGTPAKRVPHAQPSARAAADGGRRQRAFPPAQRGTRPARHVVLRLDRPRRRRGGRR